MVTMLFFRRGLINLLKKNMNIHKETNKKNKKERKSLIDKQPALYLHMFP
jgi:hypothetical protein